MTSFNVVNQRTDTPFNICLVHKGEHYGATNSLVHDKEEPLVEVYDARYNFVEGLGQFVSRYYLTTFLSATDGINLDGGVEAWELSSHNMTEIKEWILQTTSVDLAQLIADRKALNASLFGALN